MPRDKISKALDDVAQAFADLNTALDQSSSKGRPSLVTGEDIALLQKGVLKIRYLFVEHCVASGIKQKDISIMMELSPGRISQILKEGRHETEDSTQ